MTTMSPTASTSMEQDSSPEKAKEGEPEPSASPTVASTADENDEGGEPGPAGSAGAEGTPAESDDGAGDSNGDEEGDDEGGEEAGGADDDEEDPASDEEDEDDEDDELEEAFFWHDQIIAELYRACRDVDAAPVGAYKLLEALPADRMGNACYTARAARTGQVVLLRATALTPPVDRFAGQRLITELFLMRDMLAHANVVTFYDLYLVGKREVWLVQEYVADGAPLGELVAHNPGAFSEAQIARVCLEACKGLAHLHSQLILHRDIRSDSIIVDPKGHVKITNFAYAVQLPDAAAKRRTMISTLTLPGPARSPYTVDKTHWTPPEVIRRHEYGPEVDVWALGITVREMLDGAPPYADTGAAPLKVLFLIRVNGAPALRDPAPGAPGPSEALKGFLGACLEVDVERRATSARLVEHGFLEKACAPGELAPLFEWRNDVPPPEDGHEDESVPDTGPAAGVPDPASGEVVPVLEIAADAVPAPAPAASESAAAPAPLAAGSQTVSSAVEVEPLARVSETDSETADVPLTTNDPAISQTPDPRAVAGVSEAADAIAAGADGPASTVCVSESPPAVGLSALVPAA